MTKLQINLLAFNEEQFIEESIESILNQSFKDFILVIHDNKSTDRTVDICKNVAKLDRRVFVNEGAFNVGPIIQLSKALCSMDAKYSAYRSANDLIHEDYYSETIEILESDPKCSLAYSHGFEFNNDPTDSLPASDSFKFDTRGMNHFQSCVEVMIKYTCPFALWGVYRRNCFEKCRPYQFVYGGDHVLIAEMALYGSIAVTSERLDWRRSEPLNFQSGLIKNAKSQLEEHSRGISENSILFGLKQNLPFTDMAFAHFEMLSLSRVPDQLKGTLMSAAAEIFTVRFGQFMKVEAEKFFQIIENNVNALVSAPKNIMYYLFMNKAFRELDKIRILKSSSPDAISKCEEVLRKIRDRVT